MCQKLYCSLAVGGGGGGDCVQREERSETLQHDAKVKHKQTELGRR